MYFLILTANNGEQARLSFDNFHEAQRMKTAFMLTGDYSHSEILKG